MRAPFIAAGVATMALGAWLLSPHGERSRKAEAVPTAQHDEARAGLAAIDARLALLERKEALRRAATSAPSTEAPMPTAKPVGRAADAPARQRTGNEIFQGIEQHFVHEARDPAWSASAETSAAEALRAPAFAGSTVDRTACGTTLCRVEVTHDAGSAQEAFLSNVMGTPPFDQGGFAHRVHDPGSNQVKTVVYFSRAGYALPRDEQ